MRCIAHAIGSEVSLVLMRARWYRLFAGLQHWEDNGNVIAFEVQYSFNMGRKGLLLR